MLDGREVRELFVTFEDLLNVTNLLAQADRKGLRGKVNSDMFKGDLDLHIPLRSKLTYDEIEPEEILDGYIVIGVKNYMVIRCCDGMAIELPCNNEDDEEKLVIFINFSKGITVLDAGYIHVSLEGEPPLYFSKSLVWDFEELGEWDEETRVEFMDTWNKHRTRILPPETESPKHYS